MLFARAPQRFNRLHDWSLRILETIILHLFGIGDEVLGFDDRIAALATIIAVQPDRDVLGTCNLVLPELVAGDLRHVEGDLRPGAGSRLSATISPDATNTSFIMAFSIFYAPGAW